MACPALPPHLRLGRLELAGVLGRDRLGIVYATIDGLRLREFAPSGATREGVGVSAGDPGEFLRRGRILQALGVLREVWEVAQGCFWLAEEPAGEPPLTLGPELLAELGRLLADWHRQGVGHGQLTREGLRVGPRGLALVDPLGEPQGDLEALRELARAAGGPARWAELARDLEDYLGLLELAPQPGHPPQEPAPRPARDALPGHRGWVRCLAFAGGRLYSGGEDRTLRGWEPDQSWEFPAWVVGLAGRGSRLVLVTQDGLVREGERTLREEALPVLALGPEGRLAVGLRDGRVWAERELGPHAGPPQSLAWSPEGRLLAVAAADRLHLWEVGPGRLLERLEGPDPVRQLAFLGDGRLLTAGDQRSLTLWDLRQGSREQLVVPTGPVNWLAADPQGTGFACAGLDPRVLWWADSKREPRVLGEHSGQVSALAVAPDGAWLASAGQDGSLRPWSIPR